MRSAAYVLAGGRSSRMGRDKALLPIQGRSLLEHIAFQAQQAASYVALIGDVNRYINLGYPIVEDIFPGCGPLGGIHAALATSRFEWNLIIACDMPKLTADFLTALVEHAEASQAAAVIPIGPDRVPQPLCAAYRAEAAPVIARALQNGIRKVIAGLATLAIEYWQIADSHYFLNVNTPQEWAAYSHADR